MGRGRTKGKRLSLTNQDDLGSGEEEKIPAQKRRGRPQKPIKDDMDEDESQKLEDEEDSEDTTGVLDKDTKSKSGTPNGKKRRKNSQVKDVAPISVKEEIGNGNGNGNGNGTRSSTEESSKSNSFRQNKSRRKNKPRRAAEAVVECCN